MISSSNIKKGGWATFRLKIAADAIDRDGDVRVILPGHNGCTLFIPLSTVTSVEQPAYEPKPGDMITWGGKYANYEVAAVRGDTVVLWADSNGGFRVESLSAMRNMDLEKVS